jgi:Sec-independent protein translocase protein TatA
MFDMSWGELFVIGAVGVTFIGRKDLPKVAEKAGKHVGKFVGLLIGARQRMDKFAANNELQKLQSELRSGLRELDAVKSELAIASSTGGLVGRALGSSLGSHGAAQRFSQHQPQFGATPASLGSPAGAGALPNAAASSASANMMTPPSVYPSTSAAPVATANININKHSQQQSLLLSKPSLAPREHSVAAIAEEEWVKQGIGFKSRAEMGTFGSWKSSAASSGHGNNANVGGATQNNVGGASILNDLISESLIYDQYDRVLQEQSDALQSKARKVQADRQLQKEETDTALPVQGKKQK